MERRTALVTAASIAGVILTGATAVGANIRILDRSDETGVGELSAAAPASSIEPAGFSTPPSAVGPAAATGGEVTRTFLVETAGSVEVVSDGGLRLGEIVANDGWASTPETSDPTDLAVRFSSAAASYVFRAELDGDGAVRANVDQAAVRAATPARHDDDDDDAHGAHDEHEGRDDDD